MDKRIVLYIFVSPNNKPDAVINILTYWISRFGAERLERIQIVRIFDEPVKQKVDAQMGLQQLKDNIVLQLGALKSGKYYGWTFENKIGRLEIDAKEIVISDYFREKYKDVIGLFLRDIVKCEALLMDDIEDYLHRVMQDKQFKYEFDVTTMVNRHLVTVSIFIISENNDLFSWEYTDTQYHDFRGLIHSLHEPKLYNYQPIKKPRGIAITRKV